MSRKIIGLTILAVLLSCFSIQKSFANEEWNRVYLATYPRSGNHWMRFLIEEATRIATGSVYRDRDYFHLPDTFPWGGYSTDHGYKGNCRYPNPGESVVIKTHYPCHFANDFDCRPYIKAIRIIRHPVDSIYSFYMYNNGGNPPKVHIPKQQLEEYITSWRRFQEHWNNEPNVLTIRYEDLYNNPEPTLRKVLEASGYKVSEEDIQRALALNPPVGGLLKYVKNYSTRELNLIYCKLSDLMLQYGYSIFAIEEYNP